MKITFWFAILSLFSIAVIIGIFSIAQIFHEQDEPVTYTKEMVNGTLVINLTSPSLPWTVTDLGLPLIVADVIVFLYVYVNEYSFPIYIGKKTTKAE